MKSFMPMLAGAFCLGLAACGPKQPEHSADEVTCVKFSKKEIR